MKQIMRLMFRTLPAGVGLLLTSCLLYSTFPLSDENNCHDPGLEGKWITEKREPSGAVRTETAEIRDAGKVYTCVVETVEACNTGKVPYRKTERKNTSFVLTKLENVFFISVLTSEGSYQIFKIRRNDGELKIFGLNPDGVKLAEKEVLHRTKEGKIQMKVTQKKLQSWCLANAPLFSAQLFDYQKQSDPVRE